MKKILLLNLFLLTFIVNPVGSRTDISQFSRCVDGWQWRSTSGQIRLQFSDDSSSIAVIRQKIPKLTAETLQSSKATQVADLLESARTLDNAIVFGSKQRTLPDPEPLNLMQREQITVPQRFLVRIRHRSKNFSNHLMETLLLLSAGAHATCKNGYNKELP